MTAIRCVGHFCAFVLFAACDLPPNYEPKAGERFLSIVDVEHWSKDKSAGWSPFRDVKTMSQAYVITWHLGQDAPLPHAWRVNDQCVVAEGAWRNTDFSPPSHGAITFEGAAGGTQEFVFDRNGDGFTGEADAWKEGSNLSIKAAGDKLPGFEFSSTVAPEVKLTTWDLATVKSDEIKISRSKALDLAWTPGSGKALVLFMQYGGPPDTDLIHSAWCSFPADTGTGSIPLEVIKTMHEQSKVSMSHLYFGSLVHEEVTSGNTDIDWMVWNGKGATIVWEK